MGCPYLCKNVGSQRKVAPNENIYLWNHDRCLCKFVFLRFPGYCKTADAKNILSSSAYELFKKNLTASELTRMVRELKSGISQCLFNSERSSEEDLLNPRIRIHGARNKSANIHWSSTLISSMRFMSARLTLA